MQSGSSQRFPERINDGGIRSLTHTHAHTHPPPKNGIIAIILQTHFTAESSVLSESFLDKRREEKHRIGLREQSINTVRMKVLFVESRGERSPANGREISVKGKK